MLKLSIKIIHVLLLCELISNVAFNMKQLKSHGHCKFSLPVTLSLSFLHKTTIFSAVLFSFAPLPSLMDLIPAGT